MAKSKLRHTLNIIIILMAVTVSGLFVYISIVPFDLTGQIPAVRARIKPNLYGDLSIKGLYIKFLPRPHIVAKGVTLTGKDGHLLEAGSISATVKLIPLLSKNIIIEKITLEDSDLFIKRTPNGRFNIQDITRKKIFNIQLKSLIVKDSRIRFVDEFYTDVVQIELSGLRAKIDPTSKGYTYTAKGKTYNGGNLSVSGDAVFYLGSLRINGSLITQKFDLSQFSPYLKLLDPAMKLKGSLATDLRYSLHSKQSFIKGKIAYRDLTLTAPKFYVDKQDSPSGNGEVDISWKGDDISIDFSKATISMDGFKVHGSLNMSGSPGQRYVSTRINSSLMDYATFKDFVPSSLLPKKIRNRMDAFDVSKGAVAITELKIKGKISELKGAKIIKDKETFSLTLALKDFNFHYPNFKRRYSGVSGKLSLANDTITITDFSGLYGTAKLTKLTGEIGGLTKKVYYNLRMESLFDASDTLGELKHFAKGALDKIDAEGRVGITLHLSSASGYKRPLYSGSITFSDTTIHYLDLPFAIKATTGNLAFDNDSITFSALHSASGASSVEINGTIKGLKDKHPAFALKINGEVENKELNKLLKSQGLEPVNYSGKLLLDTTLNGDSDDLSVKSALDLTRINLLYKNLIDKDRGFPVTIETDLRLKGNTREITKAIVKLGGSSISLTGKFSLKPLRYSLVVPETTLKVRDLDNVLAMLRDDESASGTLHLSLKALRGRSDKATMVTGSLYIRDAFFSTTLFKKRFEDTTINLTFKGNSAEVVIKKIQIGKTILGGQFHLLDIKNQVVDFDFHSDHLDTKDLERLTPKKTAKQTARKDKKTLKKKNRITGKGKISIKRGFLGTMPFKAFITKINIDKDFYHLDPILFSINKGLVSGKADYVKDPANELLYTTAFEIQNLDLETMISGLGGGKKSLSGKLSAKIDLHGKRKYAGSKGLNGKISFKCGNGKLWRFTVITKIFSIINIISINNLFEEGLEYNTITGSFDVKDGIFSTQDLIFDSTSLRMSAYGDIDYPKREIKLTMGFHPFVTVDKIISKIPIAGWIIGGKQKSALTMYYDIKGTLKAPKVSPAPIKSIHKNIIGIIERTIKAPGRVLSQATEKKKATTKAQQKGNKEEDIKDVEKWIDDGAQPVK